MKQRFIEFLQQNAFSLQGYYAKNHRKKCTSIGWQIVLKDVFAVLSMYAKNAK